MNGNNKASDPQKVSSCFLGSGPNSPVPKAALRGVLNIEAIAPNTNMATTDP